MDPCALKCIVGGRWLAVFSPLLSQRLHTGGVIHRTLFAVKHIMKEKISAVSCIFVSYFLYCKPSYYRVLSISPLYRKNNRLSGLNTTSCFSFFPAAVPHNDINTPIRMYKICINIKHLSSIVIEAYREPNVSIVVSHECPQSGWEGCTNVWMRAELPCIYVLVSALLLG